VGSNGSRGLSPPPEPPHFKGSSLSLDMTFPPTVLSENLGGMESGRGGKGEREMWGDHLPYSPTGFCLKF